MPLALELAGSLDRDALRAALDALVARHEALRTRLVPAGAEGQPSTSIRPAPVSPCAPTT